VAKGRNQWQGPLFGVFLGLAQAHIRRFAVSRHDLVAHVLFKKDLLWGKTGCCHWATGPRDVLQQQYVTEMFGDQEGTGGIGESSFIRRARGRLE